MLRQLLDRFFEAEYRNYFRHRGCRYVYVKRALADRVQMTTDGNNTYIEAVDHYLGSNIDYAMPLRGTVRATKARTRSTAPRCASERRRR
jgi:hypothetical protein